MNIEYEVPEGMQLFRVFAFTKKNGRKTRLIHGVDLMDAIKRERIGTKNIIRIQKV